VSTERHAPTRFPAARLAVSALIVVVLVVLALTMT
jgi:hypothetical protein